MKNRFHTHQNVIQCMLIVWAGFGAIMRALKTSFFRISRPWTYKHK
jgi:hypothetical protein